MKQAEDIFTIDMHGDTQVITPDNSITPAAKTYYMFYIRTHSAQTEWTGLTKKQARDMYAYTDAHQPSNVVAYGWEEVK